jgi:hypothetical protein
MARGSDPDSRPISVAELLARAKEQDAQDGAAESSAGTTPTGTGRRRRGGKGAVSVAELTGEIPRVPESATPPPTRDFNAADVSERSQTDNKSTAGPTPTPGEPERPVLRRPQDESVAADRSLTTETSGDSASTTKPGDADDTKVSPADPGEDAGDRPTQAGATRIAETRTAESESGEKAGADAPGQTGSPTADRGGPANEETTGVIPSIQAYSQVDDSDPDRDRLDGQRDFRTAAERERDFQSYRNFEDIDDTPAAATTPKKRKRGLFGFGRKTEEAVAPGPAEPAPADNPVGNTDHDVTQLIPAVDRSNPVPGQPDVSTRSLPTADTADQTDTPADDTETAEAPQADDVTATAPQTATDAPAADVPAADAPAAGRYLRFDVDDSEQSAGSTPDLTKHPASQPNPRDVDLTGTDPVASGMPAGLREVGPTAEHGPLIHPQVHPSNADTEAVRARLTASVGDGDERTDQHAGGDRDGGTPESGTEHSPTVQWLALIGQVVAGLAVGVALFWGFTELWRWNVYFALVLAVAVIFGMVTLVHVVRRSQDLVSTLLALGVGLLVTIGPLVLLLVAGD